MKKQSWGDTGAGPGIVYLYDVIAAPTFKEVGILFNNTLANVVCDTGEIYPLFGNDYSTGKNELAILPALKSDGSSVAISDYFTRTTYPDAYNQIGVVTWQGEAITVAAYSSGYNYRLRAIIRFGKK